MTAEQLAVLLNGSDYRDQRRMNARQREAKEARDSGKR
jgi:hypothetical protein